MLSGPIAITGATGHVGRAVVERLRAVPNEVRPLGHDDDWQAALRDAQVLLHLAGTLHPVAGNSYEAANVGTARRLFTALPHSDVRRVVALSYVGASSAGENEYVRSKGRGEEWVRRARRQNVFLRSSYIFGPPVNPGPTVEAFLHHKGHPVRMLGDGLQRVAPIFLDDVVEAVVRAGLDPEAPAGTFDLVGPEEMGLDEFVTTLSGSSLADRRIPELLSRALGRVLPALDPALVDVLLADSVSTGQPSASEVLGLELHAVRDVYTLCVAA